MVYYLKYRPQTLDELDNTEVAELVKRYLSRGAIPHAFLFTGPKGTGKTSTARIIAKSINCPKYKTKGSACGTCEICQSIAKGIHLDILEIDAASNRGIDEIRDLREKIKLAPSELAFKVYIIDEVHMLTTEAFNALLKTLEEPPLHAVFILATTELHKVPETVVSRCVTVEFKKANEKDLLHSLKRIVKGERLTVDEAALMEIATIADGSFRDAAKLLEELSLKEGQITTQAVLIHVGSTDVALQERFLSLLQAKNTKELLRFHLKLTAEGKNVREFYLRILTSLEQKLIETFSAKKSEWRKDDLVKLIHLISQAFTELKAAVVPTLPFELALVEYCEGEAKQSQSQEKKEEGEMNSISQTDVSDSVEPFVSRWDEFLERLKPHNHSIVGVLRSCRPVSLEGNVITIEAAYKFHQERLSEAKVRELITTIMNEMFDGDLSIKTVLKKRV